MKDNTEEIRKYKDIITLLKLKPYLRLVLAFLWKMRFTSMDRTACFIEVDRWIELLEDDIKNS